MPEESSFIVPVARTVTITEPTAMELWQLAFERADADTRGRLVLILRPLDADGRWRTDVEPVKVEVVDDPEGQLPNAATALRALILDAIVSDGPVAQMLGIVGQPVRIAGRAALQLVAGIGGA